MSTEYLNSSNSLSSNSFDSCKRRRILSGDIKNTECDNESLMDYIAETSTKASSSSIQESIANMSNSHSTPEDNYLENALSSPFTKQNRLDIERDFDVSTDQYCKNPNGIYKSILVSSNNHASIDDTIEYVLSKIREEKDIGCNKSTFLNIPSSETLVSSSSKCDKNKYSNLNTISNRLNEFDHLKRGSSAVSYHNLNTQSMQIDSGLFNHTYSTSNFNKNHQQIYNYGNYYNIPNNFNNQINLPNYNRPTFPKDSDKASLLYQQYQCQNMPYRPYTANTYINQPYYRQESHTIPVQSNFQSIHKPIKRESYDHIMHENDINQPQAYGINFKAPEPNSCGLFDQNNRKRRPMVDTNKLTPTKKQKLISQISLNNNYEDLVNKLKTTNNNSLLMNPSFSDGKSLLPPLEFIESKTNHSLNRKYIQYQKYKSSPYFIIKPKHFQDHHESDKFISDFISETISGKVLLSDIRDGGGDNISDVVCMSPDNNLHQSDNILRHLDTTDVFYEPVSPQFSIIPESPFISCNSLLLKPSIKSKERESRTYTQLSGSFLKRTKINGKSFSNVHIEETVSVASLAASKSQNSGQNCLIFLTGLSCIKRREEPHSNDGFPMCSNCSYEDTQPTNVLIKTTPYKPSKNYKKVTDFEQYVCRKIPSDCNIKLPLLGINYRYFNESDKLRSIGNDNDLKDDLKALLEQYKCVYRSDWLTDRRQCVLCQDRGEGNDDLCGRLMNLDRDSWVHLNCGLWCFDVFETVSGSLVGVQSAVTKAAKTRCSLCQGLGAGIQCYRTKCTAVYHVPCAHRTGCVFYTDRGMYCPAHAVLNHPMELPTLRADRRVHVGRDECSLVAEVILEDVNDVRCRIRVGTLILNNVGQLLPAQVVSGRYNSSSIIYPIGYHATRIYWSPTMANQRCQYQCHIDDDSGGPLFRVVYKDHGSDLDTVITDRSCDKLWHSILARIAQLRHDGSLTRLFPAYLSGEQLFGLTEPHVVRVMESLPGVDSIVNYAFKFGRMELISAMPPAINPSGCARTEPKLRTFVRRVKSAPVAAAASSKQTSSCSVLKAKGAGQAQWLSFESPSLAAMLSCKLGNSRIQQYKRLRYDWFNNVVLSRSGIQGLGLFAAKDLEKATMIIEYIGETIRNEVGNRREQLYLSRNNSIYMFRLSDDLIIDATVRGGLARYINHSCAPNCQTEFLSLDSLGGRIVISTKQRIERGEELTYDYKFDFEDNNSDKIPCLCGAISCRGWMN